MARSDRLKIARDSYLAFAAGERGFFERRLRDDFSFSSPPDPELDREGWFARCWPGAGRGQRFEFLRLVQSGDEVIVTYELRRPDGGGGRDTQDLTLEAPEQNATTQGYLRPDPPRPDAPPPHPGDRRGGAATGCVHPHPPAPPRPR